MTRNPFSRRAVLIIAAGAALLSIELFYLFMSPSLPILPHRTSGVWIKPNVPVSLKVFRMRNTCALFRKQITAGASSPPVQLEITAYRTVVPYLDGKRLALSSSDSWKKPCRLIIPPELLSGGPHELRLEVSNHMAHPAVHISSTTPGLSDLNGWESSLDGVEWLPSLRCDHQRDIEVRRQIPDVLQAFSGGWLLPVSLAVILFAIRKLSQRTFSSILNPATVRGILLAAWSLLCINNFFKLPAYVGFDASSHVEYIRYILDNANLPLATQGWQMFQPPLYYLLSALLLKLNMLFLPKQAALMLLRLVPYVCGLVVIETTHRLLKKLFPEKPAAHTCGLLAAAFFPMNIYICQYVGNEPLAGALTALLVYRTVVLIENKGNNSKWDRVLLGVIAGLAILAKVSPLLLIPVICVCLSINHTTGEKWKGVRWAPPLEFLGALFLTAGWYFVRNWVALGSPFISGWDPKRSNAWWQDPSYRLPRDFYSFGDTFVQPVYSCFNGFADALYSTFWHDGYLSGMTSLASAPPWNYGLLGMGIILSIIPFSAMLLGVVKLASGTEDFMYRTGLFCIAAAAVYGFALLYLYASLPTYSTAKASYTMGLTPCYAVMTAAGASVFLHSRYLQALFSIGLVIWAVITYCGFFVV